MITAHRRTSPPDEITNPPMTVRESAWQMAVQPFDRRVTEIERKWGSIERLVSMTDPDLAERFGRALFNFNEAIRLGVPETVSQKASVLLRGIEAAEKNALDRGAEPNDEDVWSVNVDGTVHVVCHRTRDVSVTARRFPDSRVWSLEELIRAAQHEPLGVFADAVKAHFPGAVMAEAKPPLDWKRGDELPF